MASSTQGSGLLTPKRPLERRLRLSHGQAVMSGVLLIARRCHPCRGGHHGEAHGSRRGPGTVTSSPAGHLLPGALHGDFPAGTTVVPWQEPSQKGSKFVQWGGACAGAVAFRARPRRSSLSQPSSRPGQSPNRSRFRRGPSRRPVAIQPVSSGHYYGFSFFVSPGGTSVVDVRGGGHPRVRPRRPVRSRTATR